MGSATRDDLDRRVPVQRPRWTTHVVTPRQTARAFTNEHDAWHASWVAGGLQVIDVKRYDATGDDASQSKVGARTRVGNTDWPDGLLNIPVVAFTGKELGAYRTGSQNETWKKDADVRFETFMVPEVEHESVTKAQFVALGDEVVWHDDSYRVLHVDVNEKSGKCAAWAQMWQR